MIIDSAARIRELERRLALEVTRVTIMKTFIEQFRDDEANGLIVCNGVAKSWFDVAMTYIETLNKKEANPHELLQKILQPAQPRRLSIVGSEAPSRGPEIGSADEAPRCRPTA